MNILLKLLCGFLIQISIANALFSQDEMNRADRPFKGCSTSYHEQLSSPIRATAFTSNHNFWPNGIVPYTFHDNVSLPQRNSMLNAMSILESIANLEFTPWVGGDDPFISIENSTENSSSWIGMFNIVFIKIVDWNYPMVLVHELAHALGFFHEQSRPDRDNYVRINGGNICPGAGHNFDIGDVGVTSNIPYDFESIMHYGEFYFARCNNALDDCSDGCSEQNFVGPTIEILPAYEGRVIGQLSNLSYSDSLMFSFVYPFPHYRFFNIAHSGLQEGTHIYNAFQHFTQSRMDSNAIPSGSTVWVMPGTYENAQGIYNKSSIVKAPYGGVILR